MLLPFETVQHIAAWQVYRCGVRALHRHVVRPLDDLVVCPEQTHQHCHFCFDAAGFSQRASTESPVGLQAAQPSRPELDLRGPAPPFAGSAARAHLCLLDCRRPVLEAEALLVVLVNAELWVGVPVE